MSYGGSTVSADPPTTGGDFTPSWEVPGGGKEYLYVRLSRGQTQDGMTPF